MLLISEKPTSFELKLNRNCNKSRLYFISDKVATYSRDSNITTFANNIYYSYFGIEFDN